MTKNFSLRTHERKGNCEWHAIRNDKFLGLGQEKEINHDLWFLTRVTKFMRTKRGKGKKLFETAVLEARSLLVKFRTTAPAAAKAVQLSCSSGRRPRIAGTFTFTGVCLSTGEGGGGVPLLSGTRSQAPAPFGGRGRGTPSSVLSKVLSQSPPPFTRQERECWLCPLRPHWRTFFFSSQSYQSKLILAIDEATRDGISIFQKGDV